MGIDFGLGPMQAAVIGRHGIQFAAESLDFFQLVQCGVVAVGASAHQQVAVFALEADFGQIAFRPPGPDLDMAFHSFLGAGRWRKAQVQIAALGGEFA